MNMGYIRLPDKPARANCAQAISAIRLRIASWKCLESTTASTGRQRRGCYVGGRDASLVASMGRRRPATFKYVPKRLVIRP